MTDTDSPFETRLLATVRRFHPATARIERVARLSGGASQETWSFAAIAAGGTHDMILRRAPSGHGRGERALGLGIEAALIGAARNVGVPVPDVLATLVPSDQLGDGFVMARVAGETIPRKLLRDASYAEVRPRLANELGRILARIHAVDIAALPPLPSRTAAAEIDELFAAYVADGQPRPVFELAFRWLRAHCPDAPARLSLVHGDYRTGNFIIDRDGVAAVLDWELAHLGDPSEDLGWITVNSWRFGAIDKPVGGFGSVADLCRGYRDGGGADINAAAIAYWQTLGTLRWGVICLGMRARFDVDPQRPIEKAMIGRRTSETELDLLRLLAPRRPRGR